jgi:hypothetical protein
MVQCSDISPPGRSGSSNLSTTTALENGISARVNCSSFSRTISLAKKRSGWSVS